MIDAIPSLCAAERLPARVLGTYLRSTGWMAQASRVAGFTIFSRTIPDADEPILFVLPEEGGFSEGQRRVADALRTIAAIEERSLDEIVRDAWAERNREHPEQAPLHEYVKGFADDGSPSTASGDGRPAKPPRT